jgi:hypothetical protein
MVKDDIGQRRVLNGRMSVFHRQLTGDKGRTSLMAVFKDLKRVSSILIIEDGERSTLVSEAISLGYRPSLLVMGSSLRSRGRRR